MRTRRSSCWYNGGSKGTSASVKDTRCLRYPRHFQACVLPCHRDRPSPSLIERLSSISYYGICCVSMARGSVWAGTPVLTLRASLFAGHLAYVEAAALPSKLMFPFGCRRKLVDRSAQRYGRMCHHQKTVTGTGLNVDTRLGNWTKE